MLDCPRPNRPKRYRKPGQWLTALRRLWERRYSDGQIAELLSDLSPAAILDLERREAWNWRDIEAASVPESGGERFTARQVKHYRRANDMPGHRGQTEVGSLSDMREQSRREYQRRNGWGHLLPVYSDQEQRWTGGYELRRREVDILSALRDMGSLTYHQLCRALGITRLHSGGRFYVFRLRLAGLVQYERPRGGLCLWSLAGRALQVDPYHSWMRLAQQA